MVLYYEMDPKQKPQPRRGEGSSSSIIDRVAVENPGKLSREEHSQVLQPFSEKTWRKNAAE